MRSQWTIIYKKAPGEPLNANDPWGYEIEYRGFTVIVHRLSWSLRGWFLTFMTNDIIRRDLLLLSFDLEDAKKEAFLDVDEFIEESLLD